MAELIHAPSSYFDLRKVTPESQDTYRIPAYVIDFALTNKDLRILDYGCGYGGMLRALQKSGYKNIEGADIDQKAIQHVREMGLQVHRVRDLKQFARSKRASFDVIIMSHVLEHFPKDKIVFALQQIREMLCDGGRLLIMVPNAQSNTGCYWAYEDFTHSTLFTAGSLYHVLGLAGYKSVEFIDRDSTYGRGPIRGKALRKLLLMIYRKNIHFWNWVTDSSFYPPSQEIFTYEIKALAKK